MKLPLDSFLDDSEQVAGWIADASSLAASRPFVEHGLLQRVVYLLQSDQRAGLLFVFQGEEARWQAKVFSRARYCTSFIYTFITYCTVLLRNPKTVD
jgi:hypothetical protein